MNSSLYARCTCDAIRQADHTDALNRNTEALREAENRRVVESPQPTAREVALREALFEAMDFVPFHETPTRQKVNAALYPGTVYLDLSAYAVIDREELEELRRNKERLLNVARGCFDYSGGHRDKEREIFHHGIQTVINALEAAAKNDSGDTQVNALERMGASIYREKGQTV